MNIFTSLFLAFGLAMDAFAVAVASGSAAGGWRWARAFRLAALFGFFQALMPVVGWSAGLGLKEQIGWFDHWLAFILLSGVGGKMIYDDLKTGGDVEENASGQAAGPGSIFSLLVLAVATSIDAMAVGFSLTFLSSIWTPVLTIGLVTFALCLAGVYLGHRYRRFGRGKARLAGGLVLIGIGIKILIEQLPLFR